MSDVVLVSHQHDLGNGLMVARSLPALERRMIGPFIFLDHAGPVRLDPAAKRKFDVRPHPHIGLSTVSYLLSGALVHRDNLGCTQLIKPLAVNWMTAGRGIVHSERFDDPAAFTGEGIELLQSWVALPEADEETAPTFTHHAADVLPESRADGVSLRLIAGAAFGMHSPVRTHSPMFYLHARMDAGSALQLPAVLGERAAYVVRGRVRTSSGVREYEPRTLVVLDSDAAVSVRALEPSVVMLLGGEPLGQRYIWWNFVSSRVERIRQAAADWQAGRMALPPHDHEESIALPERPFPRPV
ncbi:MAG: pirin family protein [Rhodanobacteraceae bacterium]|nr:MAG: pirin family protein [Rhodanobacteraceae bacterium]